LAYGGGRRWAELSLDGALGGELSRLEELRLVAIEQRIDADLQLGRHRELVGELRQLVAEHCYRERLHAQLMLALYRASRQAEALEAYRHARAVLVEQLGIEPGPQLRELHQAVLAHNPTLGAVSPALHAAELLWERLTPRGPRTPSASPG
jgi:DNA-binding SARP family transcriptional activator